MESTFTESTVAERSAKIEAYASGVSWPAVIAGAFVAAALSLILLALGAGLGLSSISPWSNVGASASTVSGAAVVWLIVMQMIASGMGGYTAGRLRTKWAAIHSDEVHFRDTAHGLLVWAVGLVITVYFLTSAATTMVGGAAQLGATAASTAQAEGATSGASGYFADMLFRSNQVRTDGSVYMTPEAGRIFSNALTQSEMPSADKTYLGQVVAARTGLSQPDSEKRVTEVVAAARQAADTARKAAAHLLLWIFVALLIGAFCASYAATIGGRQRDHVKAV